MGEYEHTLADGNKVKVCDVSDLMTIKSAHEDGKAAWEKRETELTGELTTTKDTLNQSVNEKHQEVLKLQASNTELVSRVDNFLKSNGDIETVKTQLKDAQDTKGTLETALSTSYRTMLTGVYGVGQDKIADKKLDELASLVSALGIVNPKGNTPSLDRGSGVPSGGQKTAYESASAIIERISGGVIKAT